VTEESQQLILGIAARHDEALGAVIQGFGSEAQIVACRAFDHAPGYADTPEEHAMQFNAENYSNEPVRYPALHVADLFAEGASVIERYRNMVINRVNDSCLRLAVFDETYQWHFHPTSDELFLVVDGCLAIELPGGRELHLKPWECVTVPAGTHHRTRALGRTVNLCFEKAGAQTVFIDSP